MLLRATGGNGVLGKLLTFVFWCRESGIVFFAVIELVGMTVISAVVLTGSTTAAFIFL